MKVRIVQAHIMVTGRVQGVGYRWYATKKAEGLGLRGFVRNLPNGSVEIMAQGDKASLDEMVEWCWKGSPSAQVRGVDVEDVPLNDFVGFVSD